MFSLNVYIWFNTDLERNTDERSGQTSTEHLASMLTKRSGRACECWLTIDTMFILKCFDLIQYWFRMQHWSTFRKTSTNN